MPTFKASHRHAKITARKARLVIDLIRNQPVNQALIALERSPKRAAVLVKTIVRSALANAEHKTGGSIDLNDLVISEARVDEGPLLGGYMRWRPAARGRAMPYRKRTSHIHIGLDPLQPAAPPTAQSSAKSSAQSSEED